MTATPPPEPGSHLLQFFKDLWAEMLPSALKKGGEKARLIGRLLSDPRGLMTDNALRRAVGPLAFIAFAVSIQWLLGSLLGVTGRLVESAPLTVDMEQFLQQFPEESRDSVRCNMQALAWVEAKTADESNSRWSIIATFFITGGLMTLFLKLRFLKSPRLSAITFGQYLQFGAYSFGICILLAALLQALAMWLAHGAYGTSYDLFFFGIAFACYVLLPIWHYGRLLRDWEVGRFRKIMAIGTAYIVFGLVGVFTVYLSICAYVCDKM